MIIKGKIRFGVPTRLMVGSVAITKNKEKIGQLAVIVKRDLVSEVVTYGFLDQSAAGQKACESFMYCYIQAEGGSPYMVSMTNENLLRLIDAFEKSTEVEAEIDMKSDSQTLDYYYIATIRRF